MVAPVFGINVLPLASAPPCAHARVTAEQWSRVAAQVKAQGGRLIATWGSDRRPLGESFAVHAAYAHGAGLLWVMLPVATQHPSYPGLGHLFRPASRMQRATHDLLGLVARDGDDARPWLAHGHWPDTLRPLAHDAGAGAACPDPGGVDYAFVQVIGDGVHEIPVGPVHAGIIEPGHFRFAVVGEKVLRLEQRLGYTHKGIDKRFEALAPLAAHRLAGRVSGDTTVAYAWAYCMALETASARPAPLRGQWLRALALERERVANHLGDLGALGNDAAFGFGFAQFMRLKEDWLRQSAALYGHRLMMDYIAPGGVAHDFGVDALAAQARQCADMASEVNRLQAIYDGHAGLQDRFIATGCVPSRLAAELGVTGLAARASAHAIDLRADFPLAPYATLGVRIAVARNGDVAARVAVRFAEIQESLRLIALLCARLPDGAVRADVAPPMRAALGIGWIEGWRGEVLVALELDDAGRIRRCHCHDPSWHNWPALEHAVIGNIVPDFPLINKSFNLSYAGQDC